jgi:hypothetical protein
MVQVGQVIAIPCLTCVCYARLGIFSIGHPLSRPLHLHHGWLIMDGDHDRRLRRGGMEYRIHHEYVHDTLLCLCGAS